MTMISNSVERNYRNIQGILFRGKLWKEFSLKMLKNSNLRKKWVLEISFGSFFAFKTRLLYKALNIGSKLWILMVTVSLQDMNLNISMRNKVKDWLTCRVVLISILRTLYVRWSISLNLTEVFSLLLMIS